MPIKTPKPWRPQRRRKKQLRRIFFLLIASTLLIVATLLIARFLSQPTAEHITAPSDEKYYFSSSKYAGVRSKFVTRDNGLERTSIEYPLTSSETINQFIARHIETFDADFKQSVAAGSRFNQPMTQTINYQITHHTKNHLSIIVHIKQDTQGAHPLTATRFWTFDKAAGKPLTTRQLMANSDDALSALIRVAQQRVAAKLTQRGLPTSSVADGVVTERLEYFIVADETTIGFPLAAGTILPASYGEVGISIPVSSLVHQLQHPLAESLFRIPKPPKAPTPPPPAPSTTAGGDCARQACVALTFDDGPGPHTERLLDALRAQQAKATFYVLGSKVAGSSDTLKRILNEGHQIGNHSWGHPDLTKIPLERVRSELVTTNDAIRRATGYAPNTVRPPYGATNPAVQAQMQAAGMASVLWSVDTRDWADRNSAIVCQRAVGSAHNGAIILLHDIHKTSVDAVPCILDGLKKQGFQLVTVSTLLGPLAPGQIYRAR